jgi:hypothetical protein
LPNWLIKVSVTLISIAFVAAHLIWPDLKIDSITVVLLAIALAPWVIQYLKSVELPGGLKIELKDVLKVSPNNIPPITAAATSTIEMETKATVEVKSLDPIKNLLAMASTDPNLTLVGLRIEVERRLREISRIYGYGENPRLSPLIYSLRTGGILDPRLASALSNLITLGNQAAHGARVSTEAAEWIGNLAPGLLAELDKIIEQKKK